jgi:hypothetical protein
MEKFKVLGHDVNHEIIYPVYIHHVDLDIDKETKISLIDLIEQSCVTDIQNPPQLGGNLLVTQSGNLVKTQNQGIKILSDIFLEITDRLLIERVGGDVFNFLKPTEILCYGTIMGNGYAGTTVRNNYPWMFTACVFLKSPSGIREGDAGLSFIDTRGTSENSEGYVLKCIENHMVVYPSNLTVRDVGFFNGNDNDSRIALTMQIGYFPNVGEDDKDITIGKGISEEEFKRMQQEGKIDPQSVINSSNDINDNW